MWWWKNHLGLPEIDFCSTLIDVFVSISPCSLLQWNYAPEERDGRRRGVEGFPSLLVKLLSQSQKYEKSISLWSSRIPTFKQMPLLFLRTSIITAEG